MVHSLLSYIPKDCKRQNPIARPNHNVLNGHALTTVTISFVVLYVEFIQVSRFCLSKASPES